MDEATVKAIRHAVEDAFSAGVQDKRYIDINRIPLICQSIVQIGKDIGGIKDAIDKSAISRIEFEPIRNIVYGMVILILTAFLGGLTLIIFKK